MGRRRKRRRLANIDPEIQRLLEDTEDALQDFDDDLRYEEFKRQIFEDEPEPRFIVTLDGVEPGAYPEPAARPYPVQSVKPIPKKPVEKMTVKAEPSSQEAPAPTKAPELPKIRPFNICLKDTDDEDEGEEMEQTETSPEAQSESQNYWATERCRFWPACANGTNCPYAHPSIPCKTFPFCKFGDKCLYVHPQCKFDAYCTRPECPYTHTGKRTAQAPTVIHKIMQVPVASYFHPTLPAAPVVRPQQTSAPCRFFPNCHNMACPFAHPKPCRYGIGCMSKSSCSFYHPPLPGKDKLTWSSGTSKKPGESGSKEEKAVPTKSK